MGADKKITFLGWGSLLWEKENAFERTHSDWSYDGPPLKLEFSRVSQTGARRGALTLVIDTVNGTETTVAHCLSKRSDPLVAIDDLKLRERMPNLRNIGYVLRQEHRVQSRDAEIGKSILDWAEKNQFDIVLWTDLPSNYVETQGSPYSLVAAKAYLRQLTGAQRSEAFKYIKSAPSFVQTKLRIALNDEPWFAE